MCVCVCVCSPGPTVVAPVGLLHEHAALPVLLGLRQAVAVVLEPLVVRPVPGGQADGLPPA